MSMFDAGAFGSGQLMSFARRQAEQIPAFHGRHRRFLRFVDTHQKWLLVHLIADTCASAAANRAETGAAVNWIADRACWLGIVSRNTALAFLGQLAAYGYVERRRCHADRRIRLVSLPDETKAILAEWAALQHTSLAMEPADAAVAEPEPWPFYLGIAAALLDCPDYLAPPADVRLTQSMRGGWLVMSEILRHLPKGATGEAWIPAPGLSIPAMTESYGLSRSTLYRLVRVSVEAGIMAWQEHQSVSTLTVNLYHLRQYSRWIGRLLEAAAVSHADIVGGLSIGEAAALEGFHDADFDGVPHATEVKQGVSIGI